MTSVSLISKRRTAAREIATASYHKRRKQIAEAAVRVFNERGFAGASMGAVSDELSIDRATLYYYIGSKEQLFDEILREVIEKNVAIASRIRASNMSPRRKMRDMITALMSSYGANYPLIFIYIRENLSHVSDARSQWSKYMRKLNREIESAIVSIIEEGYADKSFRRVGSARIVAYGILGIIGWTHRWFRPETSELSAEEIGKIYAELILSGLESMY